MKKNVYEWGNSKGKCIKSFTEEIEWKAVSYYGGPKEEGEYYTSDGKGNVTKIHFTPYGKCKRLVEDYMEESNISIEWYDSCESFSDSEILNLWCMNGVWYDVESLYLDDGFYDVCYRIRRGDDIPKYFLEVEFTGPIDSEIDTYEEVIEE